MKRRILSTLLALCTVLALLPGTALAANNKCGDNATWKLSGGTLTISGSGWMYGYDSGDTPWYGQRQRITKVVVSDGITSIGLNAFRDCSNLKTVSLPKKLTHIFSFSFANCVRLTSINFPEGLEDFYEGVFLGCTSLKSITLPEGFLLIGSNVFDGCSNLTSISLPASLRSVMSEAFHGCNKLSTVKYAGTKSLWETVEISSGNDKLTSAAITYGSQNTWVPGNAWDEYAATIRISDYNLPSAIGKTTLTYQNARALVGKSPEQIADRVKTVGDALQYMIAARFGAGAPSVYTPWYDGWGFDAPGDQQIRQNYGCCCGGYANAVSYLLQGDYQKVGELRWIGGGNHVISWVYTGGKYYVFDFTQLCNVGDYNYFDSPVVTLSRLENYYSYLPQCYPKSEIVLMAAYETGDAGYPSQWSDPPNFNGLTLPTEAKGHVTLIYQKNSRHGIKYQDIQGEIPGWKGVNKPVGKTYTITLNANGGTVSPSSIKVESGKAYFDSLPTPTRSGWRFSGWYTAKIGGTEITASTKATANRTIYARWTKTSAVKTYTITLNANGGTVSPSSIKAESGKAYFDSLPTPTRSGWRFSGWYTAKTGGTEITASTKATANCTIYARWTRSKTYLVTFDPNGGTLHQDMKIVSTGVLYRDLPTPTRPGYHFKGWYTKRTGGTRVTESTRVNLTANQTLYAQWQTSVSVKSTQRGTYRVVVPAYYELALYPSQNSPAVSGMLETDGYQTITCTQKATLSNGTVRYYGKVNNRNYWFTYSCEMDVD